MLRSRGEQLAIDFAQFKDHLAELPDSTAVAEVRPRFIRETFA